MVLSPSESNDGLIHVSFSEVTTYTFLQFYPPTETVGNDRVSPVFFASSIFYYVLNPPPETLEVIHP